MFLGPGENPGDSGHYGFMAWPGTVPLLAHPSPSPSRKAFYGGGEEEGEGNVCGRDADVNSPLTFYDFRDALYLVRDPSASIPSFIG